MTTVLLFHHALGRTAGVEEFARRLEAAGHRVVVPDLFEGATFDSVDEGVAHAEAIGFDRIIERGVAAADGIDGRYVAAGFSLGAMPAQKLAQANNGTVSGAVLFHSAVPPAYFGSAWPTGLPLQIHMAPDDPWAEEDIETARDLVESAGAMLFEYPGTGHLLAESASPDHDADAVELMVERTLIFLGAIPRHADAPG